MSEYPLPEAFDDFPTEAELQQAIAKIEASDYPKDLFGPSEADVEAFAELRTIADEEAERLLTATGLSFDLPDKPKSPPRFMRRTLKEMLEEGEDPDSVLDFFDEPEPED